MNKYARANLLTIIELLVGIFLLIVTSELSYLTTNERLASLLNLIVPIVYILIVFFWMMSLFVRIVERETRKYLVEICGILIGWLTVHFLRYNVADGASASRHMWYLYYLGIILIPTLLLFVAVSLGHDEHYTVPSRLKLLAIFAALIIVLILTNDEHQYAFTFPNGLSDFDDYSYNFLYPLIPIWAAGCIINATIIIIRKCRNKKGVISFNLAFIPMGVILLIALFDTLTHLSLPSFKDFSLDITSIFSLLIIMTLEIFIKSGYIPSNREYRKVFSLSTNGLLVADKHNKLIANSYRFIFNYKLIRRISPGQSYFTKNNKRTSKYRTKKGNFVVYEEDISRLTNSTEEIMDLNDQLLANIQMLQEEIDTGRRHQKLVEQNRLYDLMQVQTKERIKQISQFITELENCSDPELERDILARLVVLTTYIKRRNNLVFLAEDSNMFPVSELALCIKETTDNMRVYGIDSAYHIGIDAGEHFSIDLIIGIYDMIQRILDLCTGGLHSFFFSIKKADQFIVSVRVETPTDLIAAVDSSELKAFGVDFSEEDDDDYLFIYKFAEE